MAPEKCLNCGARRIGITEQVVYFICGSAYKGTLALDTCDDTRTRHYIDHMRRKAMTSEKTIPPDESHNWVEVLPDAFNAYKRIHSIK